MVGYTVVSLVLIAQPLTKDSGSAEPVSAAVLR